MNLSGLLPLIDEMPDFRRLVKEMQSVNGERKIVVLDAAKPYLLASLYRHLGMPVLVLTDTSSNARRLHEELQVWCESNAAIYLFPESDVLPYERLSTDAYTVRQRLKVLASLSEGGEAPLIIASGHAAVQRTVPFASFISNRHIVETGMRVALETMLTKWVEMGYELESIVEVPGSISRRGGIVDIYPPNSDLPARIELLGDKVESIRFFDPASQRSLEMVPSISIVPAREMVASRAVISKSLQQLDFSNLNTETGEKLTEEIVRLLDGQRPENIEFYGSLVNDGALTDYIPAQTVVVLDQPDLIESALSEFDKQASELRRSQIERGELPLDFPVPYFLWSEILSRLDRFDQRLIFDRLGGEGQRYVMNFAPAPGYSGRLSSFLEDAGKIIRGNRRLIVVSQQANRLSELLAEQDIIATPDKNVGHVPPLGSINLVQSSLTEGWKFDVVNGTLLLTDVELFGFVKRKRDVPRRPVRYEQFLSELSNGDYVVHVDHGIARFSGLIKLNLDGGEREYLVLDYASGDKLYVPSEQIDRVGRYIGLGGYSPALSRLGTQEWNRAKQRVKQATNDLAKVLINLYSVREVLNGLTFSSDTLWQQELEASFPYIETPDQLRAVQDVKQDMEKARPMDRLVCGDVGYGKTEVAVRAAFKAIMDGMQVAVLVPTTVLAQQHFTTFSERLAAFPVIIEMLSRFRSPKEQQHVLDGLINGSVDICIGTHRLLQKDVLFKNLGLVIVDEEQRFGVVHKEKLKQLRKEVDVLTLSATPIPRTLHMSLSGVRDMSTIETPPEERLPIKSYVSPYNERLIREAILRELERNGQVFYVHNRVQKISWVARTLEALVPEARIGIAHGQMSEETLESRMLEFAEGEIDVLVCTTIIESGLDLPNVNTLIVDDADKLGLTQLYQLRGRIGRGSNRAYAYFFYREGKQLTDAAKKRLKTIFEATELGAGFRIAMKDLEIRGAGNLLGPEQSGPMGAVGFDLYCRLLTEAVSELKDKDGRKIEHEPSDVTVDLPLSAYIPDEYISDLNTRLSVYMRIAGIKTKAQVDELADELHDRFGLIPQQIKDLLYIVRIKLLGTMAGVREISYDRGQVVLKLGPDAVIDKLALQSRYRDKLRIGSTQLRMTMKGSGNEWQGLLEELLESVARFTNN